MKQLLILIIVSSTKLWVAKLVLALEILPLFFQDLLLCLLCRLLLKLVRFRQIGIRSGIAFAEQHVIWQIFSLLGLVLFIHSLPLQVVRIFAEREGEITVSVILICLYLHSVGLLICDLHFFVEFCEAVDFISMYAFAESVLYRLPLDAGVVVATFSTCFPVLLL